MEKAVVQIYEVQTAEEAEALMLMGVDRIGSVLLSPEYPAGDPLAETLSLVSRSGRQSSLIPLFLDADLISRALDHYRPDIVHFCEMLVGCDGSGACRATLDRQRIIRERFPEIRIMRSIPIAQTGMADLVPSMELARMFEPVSDIFLTDTLIVNPSAHHELPQPVDGFVGITGVTCDWDMAARLAAESGIPVILAGGISPDNVAAGFRHVRPAGVDSCTLTNAVDETGKPVRFRKDLEKVKRLIAETRNAEYYLTNEGASNYV